MERNSEDEAEIKEVWGGETRLRITASDGHPYCVKPKGRCFFLIPQAARESVPALAINLNSTKNQQRKQQEGTGTKHRLTINTTKANVSAYGTQGWL